jgi:tetratricopeptide (TPR) repeat protein
MYYLAVTLGMLGFSTVAFFSFPIGAYFPALLLFIYIGILWFEHGEKASLKSNKFLYILIIVFIAATSLTSVYSYNHLFSKHYAKIGQSGVNDKFIDNYDDLKKSLELMPESWIANQSLGRLLIVNGQPENAISYLLKAKKIKPYHSFTALNLAQAYERSGDHTHEREVLESILTYDHRNVRAWGRLTKVYIRDKDKKKANNAYKNMKINFEYFKDRSGFGPYDDIALGISLYVVDYNYAKYIYDHLIHTNPVVDNYVAYGVFIYKHLKDKLMAKSLFIEAIALDVNVKIPIEIRKDLKL